MSTTNKCSSIGWLLCLLPQVAILLLSSRALSFAPPRYYYYKQAASAPSCRKNPMFALSSSSSSSTTDQQQGGVRFLGKGSDAIVRPGVVLVAPQDEFHHFYRQAAIFVYAMGVDEDMDNEYVIRGAIIDHPTPFTLEEMVDKAAVVAACKDDDNPMANNFIFRGGDKGDEGILMLHNQESIGSGEMIGTSGLYEGGIMEALEACSNGTAKPEDFKLFFNFCQFTELELEQMLEDDPWMSVEVPPDYVLDTDLARGDCWKRLRNALREFREEDE